MTSGESSRPGSLVVVDQHAALNYTNGTVSTSTNGTSSPDQDLGHPSKTVLSSSDLFLMDAQIDLIILAQLYILVVIEFAVVYRILKRRLVERGLERLRIY